MRVVDFHCDALSKMWQNPQASFVDAPDMDVTLKRMEEGSLDLQVFAVFLSEQFGKPSMERILAQIEVFRDRIHRDGHLAWLLWKEQVHEIRQGGKRWGMLSLEGADGLEGQLFYVDVLYKLGVRFLGVTWNYANWAADGAMEKRNGGLTRRGRELVKRCNEIGMLLDVSHLSRASFWELTELTHAPIIASHSNADSVCPHPRNLADDQIRAVIALNGLVGVTFVPWFIKNGTGLVKMEDVLPHIEKICELGGEAHLMFGSDFDGIDEWVRGLEHPGAYPDLAELLLKHYSASQVEGWMSGNALRFLEANLPAMNSEKS